MNQHPDFWQYFIGLFVNVPPELKRFLASIMGTAIGLIIWPPADIRAGVGQVFMSYVVSHYATGFFVGWKKIDDEGMVEGLRVLFGFGGIAIVKGTGKLFKRYEGNPEKSFSLLTKLIELVEDYKRLKNAMTDKNASTPTDTTDEPHSE